MRASRLMQCTLPYELHARYVVILLPVANKYFGIFRHNGYGFEFENCECMSMSFNIPHADYISRINGWKRKL